MFVALSPRSPRAKSPDKGIVGGRERSGSWLGKFGEGRRRSGSVQSPASPSMGRDKRSQSFAKERSPSMSLELETVPDVLGSLMFSPRADKLEENFVIENPKEIKGMFVFSLHLDVDCFLF